MKQSIIKQTLLVSLLFAAPVSTAMNPVLASTGKIGVQALQYATKNTANALRRYARKNPRTSALLGIAGLVYYTAPEESKRRRWIKRSALAYAGYRFYNMNSQLQALSKDHKLILLQLNKMGINLKDLKKGQKNLLQGQKEMPQRVVKELFSQANKFKKLLFG